MFYFAFTSNFPFPTLTNMCVYAVCMWFLDIFFMQSTSWMLMHLGSCVLWIKFMDFVAILISLSSFVALILCYVYLSKHLVHSLSFEFYWVSSSCSAAYYAKHLNFYYWDKNCSASAKSKVLVRTVSDLICVTWWKFLIYVRFHPINKGHVEVNLWSTIKIRFLS